MNSTGPPRSRLFQWLCRIDGVHECKDIPPAACEHEPANFSRHVFSLCGTKTADGLVDPKLVLAWLLTVLGAPGFVGLLVPIREAGALFPQLFTASALKRMALRKWAWAVGAGVQGMAAIFMGVAVLQLEGVALGIAITALLATLAVARSVCSVTYKDVLGKTVSKSRRGTATGAASSFGAAAVLGFGSLLTVQPLPKMQLVTGGLFVAGLLWLGAALMFSRIVEQPSAAASHNKNAGMFAALTYLKTDSQLRLFLLTRGLLISTALAPPILVAMTVKSGGEVDGSPGELGLLVIASALAGMTSSWFWGRLSDRSSRRVLMFAAIAACVALLLAIALHQLQLMNRIWALPVLLFGLMTAYRGVRIGRATHLVDMATVETRAGYTAVSNTVIGVLLILAGGFGWLAAEFGEPAVIWVFAIMSGLGAVTAFRMKEVQSDG